MATKTTQHLLNPLHIYCRLVDMGLPTKFCKKVCKLYEKHIFNKLYTKKED